MKKIFILFCLTFFLQNASRGQSVGIADIQTFLTYAAPKLKKQSLKQVVLELPASIASKSNSIVAEIRDLDNNEILSIAQYLGSTSEYIRSVTLNAIDFFKLLNPKVSTVVFNGVIYPVINIQDSGAIGNGIADNYDALKRVFDAINRASGGEIYVPKGNFFIDRYITNPNGFKKDAKGSWIRDSLGNRFPVTTDLDGNFYEPFISTLFLHNLKYLKIYGEDGSIISVKGDFYRPATRENDKYLYSEMYALDPLVIYSSENVTVKDLEIRGNVQLTTRETRVQSKTGIRRPVAESGGRLLSFGMCKNVLVENVYTHHAQTDGIALRGKPDSSRNENFIFRNVTSRYNARQGITIENLFNSRFENCRFDSTGFSTGAYGHHSPTAGLDVEPDYGFLSVSNILFDKCFFENNLRSATLVSHTYDSKDITFKNCTITAPDSNENIYFIINNSVNTIYDSCIINAKRQSIFPSYTTGSSTIYKNSYIKGVETFRGVSDDSLRSLIIDNCTLEYIGTGIVETFFPYLKMPNSMVFTDNKIIFPIKFTKKGVYFSSSLISAKIARGNVYLEK